LTFFFFAGAGRISESELEEILKMLVLDIDDPLVKNWFMVFFFASFFSTPDFSSHNAFSFIQNLFTF